jgi:hypothetical protein
MVRFAGESKKIAVYVDPIPFLGTRGTFARLRDAKIFHIWVESLDSREVSCRLSVPFDPEVGDELIGEIFGIGATAQFRVKVDSVIDPTRFGILGANQPKVFTASIIGTPRVGAGHPNARVAVLNVTAVIPIEPHALEVLDVSMGGFAVVMPYAPVRESTRDFLIRTPHGDVSLTAEVRNTRDLGTRGTRVGFLIQSIERTGRPRWGQFFKRN